MRKSPVLHRLLDCCGVVNARLPQSPLDRFALMPALRGPALHVNPF